MSERDVRHHMSASVETVSDRATLGEVIQRMKARHIHHLCVIHGGSLLGVISDRDLLRALPSALELAGQPEFERMLEAVTAGQIMTRSPITIAPGASLEEAVDTMLQHGIHALPVLAGETLAGILTDTDCLRVLRSREGGARIVSAA